MQFDGQTFMPIAGAEIRVEGVDHHFEHLPERILHGRLAALHVRRQGDHRARCATILEVIVAEIGFQNHPRQRRPALRRIDVAALPCLGHVLANELQHGLVIEIPAGVALPDNRERLAPVTLPAEEPVAELVIDRALAETFGFEWAQFPETQFDRYSGARDSRERFRKECGWPDDESKNFRGLATNSDGRFFAPLSMQDH